MTGLKFTKLFRVATALTAVALSFTTCDIAYAEVVRNDNSVEMNKAGIPLYEWHDTSVKEPKFIVIAIHGAAQQGGILDTLGRSLASLGYLVLAPDLRGAGRWNSVGAKPSTGTFGDFVQSCDDLSRLLKVLRKEHPKAQFFCIGESAGSTVVLSAMVRESAKCRGIILCSAGSEPKMHAPGSMGPEFYKKLMHVTTPVDMSEFMTRYSSDDRRVSDEMIHDPLGRNKLSALELLGTFNFIQQGSVFATQIPRTLPTLLIQGEQDQIINPNSAPKLLNKIASTDKKLLMLPSCGHILIGTTYVKPVVEDTIINWLAAHGGLKAAMVSHAFPPNAPQLQTVSYPPAYQTQAPEAGRQSLINTEEWREENAAATTSNGMGLPAVELPPTTPAPASVPASETLPAPSKGSGDSMTVPPTSSESAQAIQPASHGRITPAPDAATTDSFNNQQSIEAPGTAKTAEQAPALRESISP